MDPDRRRPRCACASSTLAAMDPDRRLIDLAAMDSDRRLLDLGDNLSSLMAPARDPLLLTLLVIKTVWPDLSRCTSWSNRSDKSPNHVSDTRNLKMENFNPASNSSM
jgi:hypothetical protein